MVIHTTTYNYSSYVVSSLYPCYPLNAPPLRIPKLLRPTWFKGAVARAGEIWDPNF